MSGKVRKKTDPREKLRQHEYMLQWIVEQHGAQAQRLSLVEQALSQLIDYLRGVQGGEDPEPDPETLAESTSEDEAGWPFREQIGRTVRSGAGEMEGAGDHPGLDVRADQGEASEEDLPDSGLPGAGERRDTDILRDQGIHGGGRERKAQDGSVEIPDVPMDPDNQSEET